MEGKSNLLHEIIEQRTIVRKDEHNMLEKEEASRIKTRVNRDSTKTINENSTENDTHHGDIFEDIEAQESDEIEKAVDKNLKSCKRSYNPLAFFKRKENGLVNDKDKRKALSKPMKTIQVPGNLFSSGIRRMSIYTFGAQKGEFLSNCMVHCYNDQMNIYIV